MIQYYVSPEPHHQDLSSKVWCFGGQSLCHHCPNQLELLSICIFYSFQIFKKSYII